MEAADVVQADLPCLPQPLMELQLDNHSGVSNTGAISTAVATGKYAEPASPGGQYATRVQEIVQACHNQIDNVKIDILQEARTDTDGMRQGALYWAQSVMDPQSVRQLTRVNCAPIEAKFTALARQVANLRFGERIIWPVSVCFALQSFFLLQGALNCTQPERTIY